MPVRLFLPESLQLIIGVPAILAAFGAVLWTKGFGPEDRELFRMRKKDVEELREAEARDMVAEDVVLVPEVPHAREQHGDAGLIRRRDHLFVAD